MAEVRGIMKLFGKIIPVPVEGGAPMTPAGGGGGGCGGAVVVVGLTEEGSKEESPTGAENGKSGVDDGRETAPAETPESDKEGSETAPVLEKKAVKKPDKVLPCPRCNSMDTKFCYYNNYNLGQPRHFCRGCQRYWTAGGAMRNLPVGAGRRKSKHSAFHHRHLTMAEASALQGIHQQPVLKPNGILLSLGGSTMPPPLCNTMALALNLAEQRMPSSAPAENGEEHSAGSSVTASSSNEEGFAANLQEPAPQNSQGNLLQPPCLNTVPWPSHLWSSAPAFPCSGIPISFYPITTYWGSTPSSCGGSSGPAPSLPTLGKHSRDESAVTEIGGERRPGIPKTVRIDDHPEEVAMSSVWAAMGVKGSKVGSRGGLFTGFDQGKEESRKHAMETSSQVLQANPVARLRSLNLHESL